MDDKVNSGTTFFLDSGKKVFGVTAGHVYADHRDRANASGVLCQIGLGPRGRNKHIDLRERIITHSAWPDIATYEVSREEIDRTGAQVVKETAWPPASLKEGEAVVFTGFPGVDRRIEAPGLLSFEHFCGAARVDNINAASISCLRPDDAMPIADLRFPAPYYDTRGMSGGPMFYVDRGPILSWHLVGVIGEGGGGKYEGEGGPLLDIVTAGRADLINADGTINEIPRGRRRDDPR
ncbi:MAG TPA: hypothetical protein VMT03_18515 [Polyangia bacterium]|nr:hypothetical protein [Polyangia bacterium]